MMYTAPHVPNEEDNSDNNNDDDKNRHLFYLLQHLISYSAFVLLVNVQRGPPKHNRLEEYRRNVRDSRICFHRRLHPIHILHIFQKRIFGFHNRARLHKVYSWRLQSLCSICFHWDCNIFHYIIVEVLYNHQNHLYVGASST